MVTMLDAMRYRRAGPAGLPPDQLSGLLMAAYQGYQPAIDKLRQSGYAFGAVTKQKSGWSQLSWNGTMATINGN